MPRHSIPLTPKSLHCFAFIIESVSISTTSVINRLLLHFSPASNRYSAPNHYAAGREYKLKEEKIIESRVSEPKLVLALATGTTAVAASEAEAVGNLVKDVNVAKGAAKGFLARTQSVDGNISKGVDTLRLAGRESAVDDDAVNAILGVGVVFAADLDSRQTGTVLVNLVVLTAVRASTNATSNSVARLPVGREVNTGAVLDTIGLLSVLREARLLVNTNGVALGALVLLLGKVLGISRAVDTNSGLVCEIILMQSLGTYSKPWPWSAVTRTRVSSRMPISLSLATVARTVSSSSRRSPRARS